jgi:hypothetical protein
MWDLINLSPFPKGLMTFYWKISYLLQLLILLIRMNILVFGYMINKPCIGEKYSKLMIGVTSHSPKILFEKLYRICIGAVLTNSLKLRCCTYS